MKATVNLPKALYQRVHSRSLRERRPVATILAELIREALGPHSPHTAKFRTAKPDEHRQWREELLE